MSRKDGVRIFHLMPGEVICPCGKKKCIAPSCGHYKISSKMSEIEEESKKDLSEDEILLNLLVPSKSPIASPRKPPPPMYLPKEEKLLTGLDSEEVSETDILADMKIESISKPLGS